MTDAEREEQRIVLERLRRHGAILAESFRLPLRSIDAETPRVKRRYGICYDDGSIRIRLRSVRSGELLKYSSMVDTLCHELAHLEHFNHGKRFWPLYERILAYARRRGIYRPGPERPVRISPEYASLIERARPTQVYPPSLPPRNAPWRHPQEPVRPERKAPPAARPPKEPGEPRTGQLELF